MAEFECSSLIPGDAQQFLDRFDMRSVNRELGPLIRMTAPPELRETPIAHWRSGESLFASWVLLLGFLPLDRHFFQLAAVNPKRGFNECSSSWINREWRHERSVEAVGDSIRISDRVSFRSRLPGMDRLLLPLYRAIFSHRHKRLRRFSASAAGGQA